jgi:hypothetical protein
MADHLEVHQLEESRGLDICGRLSIQGRHYGTQGEQRTHVLTANFGAAFFQAVLDVFLFVAFVVPQPSDEVVERLFEPGELSAEASVEAPTPQSPKAPKARPKFRGEVDEHSDGS